MGRWINATLIFFLTYLLLSAQTARGAVDRHDDMFGAFSPDGKRIAFMSDRSGDPEIYVGSVDGKNVKRLTFVPGRDAHPAWSPDGQKIIFQSPRIDGDVQLFTMNPDGSDQRLLVKTTGFCGVPAWSPNGKEITFQCSTARTGPGKPESPWRLFIVGSDGKNLHQLSHGPGNDQVPNWSPDGKNLLFFSDRSGQDQIYELELKSRKTRQLTTGPDVHRVAEYAQAGRKIILMKEARGAAGIYLLDPETGFMKPVTGEVSGFQAPRISSDGKAILYQSTTPDGERLFLMPMNGGQGKELKLKGKAKVQ